MKHLLLNPITIWLIWFYRSRKKILKEKGKHLVIGNRTILHNVIVGQYNTFYENISILDSQIDDFVYVASNTKIVNSKIGKFCSIGPDVKIGLGKHPSNFISTSPIFFSTQRQCQITFADNNYFEETGQIVIGNDVWIGANATIMYDITIGDGAIIAAGAIVTKDVDPYTIVGGIPAHPIKKRFTPEEIRILLNFNWWNKDLIWLRNNFSSFNAPDLFFKNITKE